MAYKILKPEITSVYVTAWNTLKKQKLFWFAVLFSIFLSLWFFSVYPFLIIPFYYLSEVSKARVSFWKEIAEINGWQYKGNVPQINEEGIMFRQGDERSASNYIEGNIDERHFRMFNYVFRVGSGKNKRSYQYTVFAFKFNGSFPHIYLNNKHNSYNISTGESVPVPAEFEKMFTLSAPRKYEVEALEIFTPDVFSKLLDGGFTHDIEFVDHELIMFIDGSTDTFEKLEKEFNRAMELEDLLDEKLDRFKFHKIGDISHKLK